MKKLHAILFSFTVLGLFAIAACNNASNTEAAQDKVIEEQGDLREAREELSEEYQKEQVELQTEIRDAQNRVDERLVDLRVQLNDAQGEAKDDISQRINRLEVKRDKLAKDLDRVDYATNNDWQNFKMDVRKTLDELGEDLN